MMGVILKRIAVHVESERLWISYSVFMFLNCGRMRELMFYLDYDDLDDNIDSIQLGA